ncbi:hypothetical protein ACVP6W_002267 [Vibrio cholerae]
MSSYNLADLEQYKIPSAAIKKMGEASGLPMMRIATIIPSLQNDILRTMHTNGQNKVIDALVEKAFLNLNVFAYRNRADRVVPLFIKGPPGHGKTTAFRIAAMNIAQAMGVRLFINPTIIDSPSETDIILVEATLAGLLSPTSIIGLPNTDNGVTVYVPPARMKMLSESPMSIMILDDLENAVAGVKNAAMPAILDKLLVDLKLGDTCYVGATGNLGNLDNTNTTMGTDALFNRMKTVFGYDTLGDWLERAYNNSSYQDEIGLCFLDVFLIQNPNLFYPDRDSKTRGPTATSRSYDGLLGTLRNEFGDYLDRMNAGLNPPSIEIGIKPKIHSQVGKEVAEKMNLLYHDVLSVAYPAALEAMSEKRLSSDTRELLYNLIAIKKDENSETVARSFLRQVEQIATSKIFNICNSKVDSNDEIAQKKIELASVLQRFSEAMFSVGLVRGNKTDLIAYTVLHMAKNLISKSNALPASERHFDFGHLNSHKLPVLSDVLVNALTTFASKVTMEKYGEGMYKVGGTDDKPITAVQTTIVDPLTQTSQIMKLQQEAIEAQMH